MKRWFAPLGIFVTGNLLLLIVSLFLPAVDTAQTSLNSTLSENETAQFWGWSWLMTPGVVRWFTYLVFEGLILFGVVMAFLKGG